jgi:hypothetical protein
MTLDDHIADLVRKEVARQLAERFPKKQYASRPCGRGNAAPNCMGSAARGPDYCTCVKVEFYR